MKKQLLILLMLMPMMANADDPVEINGIWYNLITKARIAEVTSGTTKYTGDVVIPATIKYEDVTYSVTTIGDNTFKNCSNLTSVTIPNSVTAIGEYAFYGCSRLSSVTIPNSVTSIGDLAFYQCWSLTSVTIPNNVTTIGFGAFEDSGLTSVTIGNSVTAIGEYAFYGCSRLSSVTIGNSVTSIGEYAFAYCPLTTIKVDLGNTKYNSHDNCNAIVETFTNVLIVGCKNTTIPNSVTTIGDMAFFGCEGLTSLTIPNSVTTIGDRAFEGCGLTSLTIPNSVTSIGKYAFSGCSSLTSVTIPSSVTTIEERTFYWCGLTSVTIPNSVISIGEEAFFACHNLTSATIGNSVTSIGKEAFFDCSSLTSVIIPNSVTSIDSHAFSGCQNLTSVTIGNSVTSIGGGAFESCGLTSVTIPNSVTTIGGGAFGSCYSLTSVTIPNSVTTIGGGAFESCGLTSVTIPNSVTTIESFAFGSCRNLTSVTIGNSVTSIGEWAFTALNSLTDVYCHSEKVPSGKGIFGVSTSSYELTHIENAILHVPKGSIALYQATEPWSGFGSIVPLSDEDGGPKKCEKPTISYHHGELSFASSTEGVDFVSEITDTDIKMHNGSKLNLSVTYIVSVYATKAGYQNSETTIATLCWIDVDPKTEGIENGIANVKAMPVLIQGEDGVLHISGAPEGTAINVYEIGGQLVGSAKASSDTTVIPTTLPQGSIAIVKIGDKAVKVMMK